MNVHPKNSLELNRYKYGNNNPLNRIDPTGNAVETPEKIVTSELQDTIESQKKKRSRLEYLLLIGLVVSVATVGISQVGANDACLQAYTNSILFATNKNTAGLLAMEATTSPDCMIPLQKNSRTQLPNIAEHIADAQVGGYPMLLTYDGDQVRKNRRRNDVCYNASTSRFVPGPPPNTSCDEYPYASTLEGGIASGRNASTRGVPPAEQTTQGQVLARFYSSARFYRRYNPNNTNFAAIVLDTGTF